MAATPIRRTFVLLGAAWLLVAYIVTTAQATAMVCPAERPAPVATTAALPPCHGHAPAEAPADEPAPSSKPCSSFCQLVCHGVAFLAQPALAVSLIEVPGQSFEVAAAPLPILPDTIDHVPLPFAPVSRL